MSVPKEAKSAKTIPGSPIGAPAAAALCIAGAALYFLSFLNFSLYALTWVCFVPALIAIRGATVRRTLWLGAIFGTVTNAGGFYWVIHLLEEFGHLHLLLAVTGFLLLCAYQGFLLAIVLALVRRAQGDLGVAPVWSLAVVFPALELAYPLLFPSYIGNSQVLFTWITQVVDISGMAGLTILIALVNGAAYEVLESRFEQRRVERARIIVPILAFVVCAGYGIARLPGIDAKSRAAPAIEVGLIQTNIGASEKAANRDEFIANAS